MMPGLRARLLLRRFARNHPRLNSIVRAFFYFSIAFGSAFGFVTGSRSQDYNPHAFAIGVSFLFALACTALAIQSMRFRWLRRQVRKIAARNEALADRNWELKDAEERARRLFEAQGDLVVRRDSERCLLPARRPFARAASRQRLSAEDDRAERLHEGSRRHARA
jgi:hypothetical protein